MGIQGLLPILKPITKSVHVSKYSGQKVAVDGYSWLHKGVFCCAMDLATGRYTNKHIMFCVSRVEMLRQHGVEPILVFDGGPLPMKAEEEDVRRRSRQENHEKALALMQAGNMSGAEQAFQKAVDVSPGMARQVIEELRNRNVRCLVAPYEADAQMAYLALKGDVQAVVTEDSDLLVYGCPRVLFKLDKTGHAEEIRLDDLQANSQPSMANFTHTMFQELCVMAGCDFLGNLPNIGIKKSHGFMKRFKSFVKVCKHLRFEGRVSVPSDYEQRFQRALWVFRHQRVYCPHTHTCVHLRPLPPGGLGAADVDVPSALPQSVPPDNPDGLPQDDTGFLGPELEPDVVQGIADGHLDPFSQQPFDLAQLYSSWPRLPVSVAQKLGVLAQPKQQGPADVGGSYNSNEGGSSGAMGSGQRPYTTLGQLATQGQGARSAGAAKSGGRQQQQQRHPAGKVVGRKEGKGSPLQQQHNIVHMFAAAHKRNHATLTAPFIPPTAASNTSKHKGQQQQAGKSVLGKPACSGEGKAPLADAAAVHAGTTQVPDGDTGRDGSGVRGNVVDAGEKLASGVGKQPVKLLRLGLHRKAVPVQLSGKTQPAAVHASLDDQGTQDSQENAALAGSDQVEVNATQQEQLGRRASAPGMLRDVTNLPAFSCTVATSSTLKRTRPGIMKHAAHTAGQAPEQQNSPGRAVGSMLGAGAAGAPAAELGVQAPRPLSLVIQAWGRASGGFSQGSSIPSLPSQGSTHFTNKDSVGVSEQGTSPEHQQQQQQQQQQEQQGGDVQLDLQQVDVLHEAWQEQPQHPELCRDAGDGHSKDAAGVQGAASICAMDTDHVQTKDQDQQAGHRPMTTPQAGNSGCILYQHTPLTTPKPATQGEHASAGRQGGDVSTAKRRRACGGSPMLAASVGGVVSLSPDLTLAGAGTGRHASMQQTQHQQQQGISNRASDLLLHPQQQQQDQPQGDTHTAPELQLHQQHQAHSPQGVRTAVQPRHLLEVLQGSDDVSLQLMQQADSPRALQQPQLLSALLQDSQEMDWRPTLLSTGLKDHGPCAGQTDAAHMQVLGYATEQGRRRRGGMSKLLQHMLESPGDSRLLLQPSQAHQQPTAAAGHLGRLIGSQAHQQPKVAGGAPGQVIGRQAQNPTGDAARYLFGSQVVGLGEGDPDSGRITDSSLMHSSELLAAGYRHGDQPSDSSGWQGMATLGADLGADLGVRDSMEVIDLAADSPGRQQPFSHFSHRRRAANGNHPLHKDAAAAGVAGAGMHQQDQDDGMPDTAGEAAGQGQEPSGPHSFHTIGHVKEYIEIASAALDEVQGRQQHEKQTQPHSQQQQQQQTVSTNPMAFRKFACGKAQQAAEAGHVSMQQQQHARRRLSEGDARATGNAALLGGGRGSKLTKLQSITPRSHKKAGRGTGARTHDDMPSVFVNAQGERAQWQKSGGAAEGLRGLVRLKAPGLRAQKQGALELASTGSEDAVKGEKPKPISSRLTRFLFAGSAKARA